MQFADVACALKTQTAINFGVQKRLRAFLYPFFTGGVVKANGSCRACFLRKQSRGGRTSSPSQSPLVTALPKGEPLAWRHSFRLNCKVCGFARASPFGRGGIASAMTERASPLPCEAAPLPSSPASKPCLRGQTANLQKKLQFFLEKGRFPIDSLVIIGV